MILQWSAPCFHISFVLTAAQQHDTFVTWPAVQVMGSPNSSYVWIQFMAHLVTLGQLDAARAVAERALATINFRCTVM